MKVILSAIRRKPTIPVVLLTLWNKKTSPVYASKSLAITPRKSNGTENEQQ